MFLGSAKLRYSYEYDVAAHSRHRFLKRSADIIKDKSRELKQLQQNSKTEVWEVEWISEYVTFVRKCVYIDNYACMWSALSERFIFFVLKEQICRRQNICMHAHVSLDMPTAIESQQLNLDKSDIDPAYDPNR